MPQIRIKNGKQKGKVISLRGADRLMIGRDSQCGLQIVDQGVSREHAEIYRVGEMVFIRDMGSRNGCFVNDEKIEEELLREGDVIRVGGTHLAFESSRETREQDLQFDDDKPFKTSLELKLDDLYVLDSGIGGRGAELFKAMCQATQVVQSERDEKKLFERLLDLIQEYIPADYLYLFLRDETTGSVTPRAMRQKTENKSIPISRSILRRVISEARAILTSDAMQDERFKADDSILMNQIRAVLCVPIQSGARPVMGAIYTVNSSLTDTFDQGDLQLITALGAQLALSLENLNAIRIRRRMFLSTIGRLVSLLEGLPPPQLGHAERVSACCDAIATELGLADHEILYAALAGLLYDIGRVPAVSGFSAAEAERGHGTAQTLAAIEFLRNIPGLQNISPAIRAHLERFDGSGLPQQLKGEAIPLGARIVAVASDFDKLTHPQGAAASGAEPDAALVKKAFTHLDEQAGKLYDPNVVRALIVSYRHGALRAIAAADTTSDAPAVESSRATPPGPLGMAISAHAPTGETARVSKSSKKGRA